MIADAIQEITGRIAAACARSGRAAGSVKLVAVVKARTPAQIQEAIDAGSRDIGENRVQEAREHVRALEAQAVRWHMIGHLQTNKAREAVRVFDLIHSVDTQRLAAEIDTQARRINKIQDVLIEVKTSEEETKSGVLPRELPALAAYIAGLKNVRLQGLMTVAAMVGESQAARPYFRHLRQLRDDLNAARTTPYAVAELSMGMSDDFETAIEEGATIVRIGRRIFHER